MAALAQILGPAATLASFGDALPAGVFVADARGRWVYTNDRLRQICGFAADPRAGDEWTLSIHPDDRLRIVAEWSHAIATGVEEWLAGFRCCPPNGGVRWVSVRATSLRDANGGVVAFVGTGEDVTAPREAEAAVARSQQRHALIESKFAALLAASGALLQSPTVGSVLAATMALAKDVIEADAYAVWRLHASSREWRIAAAAGIPESFTQAIMATYDSGDVRTVPFSTPLAVEDVSATSLLGERQSAYASEGIRSMLVVPLKIEGALSGTLVFYYRTTRRFDDVDVQTAGALGNLASAAITTAELYDDQLRHREQAERARQQAAFLSDASAALGGSLDYEATLRTLARLAVPDIADWCAVDIVDEDGVIRRLAVAHVDPAKVELARSLQKQYPEDPDSPHSVGQVIRTGRSVIVPSISDELLVAAARSKEHLRALRALGLCSYMSVPLVAHGRAFGAVTFVSAESARTYGDDDARFAHVVATRAALAVDNARAYTEARAANRAKDEFLATLSHELRTPINAIMGWAQMLQRGIVDGERLSHAIEAIARNAAAQSRLIEDLLDLSRIITGNLRLDVEVVDVSAVVAAAITSIEPAAQAKGVRLQTTMDAGSARVYGDRQRLQQVVWNLLTNAVKFTPRGGRVQIQVLRINSHLEIVVSDTGAGIPAEALPVIFERFRQADGGTTRQHSGLGLGLAIVRHLVELHGGTVEAASDGPGTGATLRIQLPISIAKPAGPQMHAMDPAARAVAADPLEFASLPDLTGTRVLVVEDESDAREMMAYLLRQRHAEVTLAASTSEALRAMDAHVPDVVLSDIEMPGEDGYALIAAIRARPSERGGAVPAAAVTARSRSEDRAKSMLAGFDAHLSKPVDVAELVATVARLNARRTAES